MDDGSPIHGHTGLEIVWTLIPTILVVGIAVYSRSGARAVGGAAVRTIASSRCTSEQFAWTFSYPDIEVEGGKPLTTGELVLPIDQTVEFEITSKDVLHSFWVPEWRMKQDAVQGITTRDDGQADSARHVPGRLHRALRARARAHALAGARALPGRFRGLGRGAAAPRRARAARSRARSSSRSSAGAATSSPTPARSARSGRTSTKRCRELTRTSSWSRSSNPSAEIAEGYEDGVMPANFGELFTEPQLDGLVEYLLEATGGGAVVVVDVHEAHEAEHAAPHGPPPRQGAPPADRPRLAAGALVRAARLGARDAARHRRPLGHRGTSRSGSSRS